MTKIEIGKELLLKNVLSLRKKMTQTDINFEMTKIKNFFEANKVNKAGSVITTTHSIEIDRGIPVLDMEILVPMDRYLKDQIPKEYKIKPVFKISNALYVRNEGNPSNLERVYKDLTEYITENGLQQITSSYNVTVKEILPGMALDEAIIDVYIGINPNIL